MRWNDLFDAAATRQAVAEHNAVINLATNILPVSRAFFPRAWRINDRIRHQASAILAEAALVCGVRRYIQEAFAPIYPDCGKGWIGEHAPVQLADYNRFGASTPKPQQKGLPG